MRKDGITALEVLIVIIIIGILTAIALPKMTGMLEINRGGRAVKNIELIAGAIKTYYIKYENIDIFKLAGLTDLIDINANLNLDLKDPYFDYTAIHRGAAALEIEITATRNSGGADYINKKIMYEIDPADGNPDGWMNGFVDIWPWHP